MPVGCWEGGGGWRERERWKIRRKLYKKHAGPEKVRSRPRVVITIRAASENAYLKSNSKIRIVRRVIMLMESESEEITECINFLINSAYDCGLSSREYFIVRG